MKQRNTLTALVLVTTASLFGACDQPDAESPEAAPTVPSYAQLVDELELLAPGADIDAALDDHGVDGLDFVAQTPHSAAGWWTLEEGEYEDSQLLYADACGTVTLGPVDSPLAEGALRTNLLVTASTAAGFDLGTTIEGEAQPGPLSLSEAVQCDTFGPGFSCQTRSNEIPGNFPVWPGGPYDALITQSTTWAGKLGGDDAFVAVTKQEDTCEGPDCEAFIDALVSITAPELGTSFECSPSYVLSGESFVLPLAPEALALDADEPGVDVMGSAAGRRMDRSEFDLGSQAEYASGECSTANWPEPFVGPVDDLRVSLSWATRSDAACEEACGSCGRDEHDYRSSLIPIGQMMDTAHICLCE